MNKKKILVCVAAVIALFCCTYFFNSYRLSKKVDNMSDMSGYVTELDERNSGTVVIHYNNKDYDNLDDLKGLLKAGDSVTCTITYDNKTTSTKTVAVFNSTNKKDTHVRYMDKGSFGYLYMPVGEEKAEETENAD